MLWPRWDGEGQTQSGCREGDDRAEGDTIHVFLDWRHESAAGVWQSVAAKDIALTANSNSTPLATDNDHHFTVTTRMKSRSCGGQSQNTWIVSIAGD